MNTLTPPTELQRSSLVSYPAAGRGFASASESPPGEHTVLIVDDDEAIRMAAAMLLECMGIKTVAAPHGFAALQQMELTPHISAVLLDLYMPVMNGEETFRELRKFWPETPVILMSGFNQSEVAMRFEDPPPDGFVQKPFTLAKLIGVLGGVLN